MSKGYFYTYVFPFSIMFSLFWLFFVFFEYFIFFDTFLSLYSKNPFFHMFFVFVLFSRNNIKKLVITFFVFFLHLTTLNIAHLFFFLFYRSFPLFCSCLTSHTFDTHTYNLIILTTIFPSR